jgi:hypothetical protein
LLANITGRGGKIVVSLPGEHAIAALIPLDAVEPLAERN